MPVGNYPYQSTPSQVAGAGVTEQFLNTLGLFADAPQFRKTYYKRHNYHLGLYLMLKELGLMFPSKSPNTGHYEQDWIKQAFSPSAVTLGTTAGSTSTITLGTTDMYTPTISGTAVPFSFPKVGDIIEIPGTRIQFYVTAKNTGVNPHVLTVQPDASVTPSTAGVGGTAAFVVNGRYPIVTNANAAGSGPVAPTATKSIRYQNQFTIVKSQFTIDGSSITSQLPYEPIEGMPGSYVMQGMETEEILHYDRMSHALMFGQQLSGITVGPPTDPILTSLNLSGAVAAYNTPVKFTQGMIPYYNANGQIYNHTPGAVSLDDIDSYGVILERERVAAPVICSFDGFQYHNDVENSIKDYLDNTYFNYAKDALPDSSVLGGGDPMEYFVFFGFRAYHKGSFTYISRKQPEFTDPQGMGATGFGYPNYSVKIPMGSFTDTKTKESFPLFSGEYKELDGYSREIEIYKLGGAGPIQKTSPIDAMSFYWQSEIAFHGSSANQVIISKAINT
jgi:hypothetical protein